MAAADSRTFASSRGRLGDVRIAVRVGGAGSEPGDAAERVTSARWTVTSPRPKGPRRGIPGLYLAHVNLEVADLARARRFYDRAVVPVGFRRLPDTGPAWLGYRAGRTTLWITVSRPARAVRGPPRIPTDGSVDPISDHLGFRVPSARSVRAVEARLRRHGLRPVYGFDRVPTRGTWYVSCAFADPDGNVLEFYAVTPRRRTTVRASPPGPRSRVRGRR